MTKELKAKICASYSKAMEEGWEELNHTYNTLKEAIHAMVLAELLSDIDAERMLDFNLAVYMAYNN